MRESLVIALSEVMERSEVEILGCLNWQGSEFSYFENSKIPLDTRDEGL